MKKTLIIIAFLWLNASMDAQDFQVTFDDDEIAAITNVRIGRDTLTELVLMNIPGDDTIRFRIIEKARQYLGVNYKWGQSNEDGFDCSGYVKYIYGHFGYALPHSSYEQYNSSRRLTEKKAKAGDLIFFVTRGARISHVGIYLGNNVFIHAPSRGKQVCVESLDNAYFKKHLAGFGTIL